MSREPRINTLWLGIDGLSPRNITEDLMPRLRAYIDDNDNVELRELDCVDDGNNFPHTGPQWTSQYTGVAPEEHGITDRGWIEELRDHDNVQTKTLFEAVDSAGLNQFIFNMPVTYPVPHEHIGGDTYMVAGFPAPPVITEDTVTENVTYVMQEAASIGRNVQDDRPELPLPDVEALDPWYERMDNGERNVVIDHMKTQERIKTVYFKAGVQELYGGMGPDGYGELDFAAYGTTAIDKIQHLCGQEPDNPHFQAILDQVDQSIAAILSELQPRHVVLTSDHGFAPGEKRHDRTGTLIYNFNKENVPDDMDMTDVTRMLSGALLLEHGWIGSDRDAELDTEADEETKRRLENLGYMED